ncbi:MAG TPA: hypothetical protein VJQ09_05425 [Candidatus Limnocylindria bacterium]|nr:hypothetical protein [Candidatus Limnocylindria bacterium]
MSNCGDDVTTLWSLSLFISVAVALLPFAYGSRRGQGALGCGGSVLLGLLVPLIVTLEPFYIGLFRPLLDCGSLTRIPVILLTAPALVLVGALMLILMMRRA